MSIYRIYTTPLTTNPNRVTTQTSNLTQRDKIYPVFTEALKLREGLDPVEIPIHLSLHLEIPRKPGCVNSNETTAKTNRLSNSNEDPKSGDDKILS